MKIVCAWCRTLIRESPDVRASHGICPACVENFSFQDGVSLQCFLDSIPVPVVAVDGEGRAQAANAKAREVSGQASGPIQGKFVGMIFSCAFSRLPEGCGRTIHCSGCTIRKAITATFHTGEPQVSVPATLAWSDWDQTTEIQMTVTTVKTDRMVLLRLEKQRRGPKIS